MLSKQMRSAISISKCVRKQQYVWQATCPKPYQMALALKNLSLEKFWLSVYQDAFNIRTVYLILFPMSSFSLFFASNSTSKKIQYAKMIHCIVCFIFMKLFNLQKWLIQIKKLHICPILCWFCDTYEKKTR